MKLRLKNTLLLLLSVPALAAADEPRLSTFDRSKIARDPFARIDTSRMAEQTPVTLTAGTRADEGLENLCKVTAVSIDRLGIAVINGKAFAEQEKFFVSTKDRKIHVTVLKVSKDGVELDCGGTIVIARIIRGM